MKRILALVVALLLSAQLVAAQDASTSGNFTAPGQTLVLDLENFGAATVQVAGVWVGTLEFEATVDGTNYVALTAHAPGSATTATATAANGVFEMPVSSYQLLRVRASALASGTAAVAIRASGMPSTGPIVVMSPPGAAGLTDAELRASPISVQDGGGSLTVDITSEGVPGAGNPTTAMTLGASDSVNTRRLLAASSLPGFGYLYTALFNGSVSSTLKNPSTPAVATDTSLVVALNPNSPLGAGTAIIGALVANQTVAQATATNLKTQAENYQGGAAVGAANPLQVSLANTGSNATSINTVVASALPAGNNNIGDVDLASAIPAGTNNIGDVDVLTLPAIPAGSNNIGDVDIASAIPAGNNNIGDVDIASALPAGGNNIGDVDVLTVPADPFGANADAAVAAGATGSIQAKLRRLTQGVEDLKTLTVLAAGNNNIGDVDVATIAAGNNNIGDVDVASIAAGNNNIGDVDVASVVSTFANAKVDATGSTVKIDQTTTANDVDVISDIPGVGATNLGKAEDAGHTTADTGVAMWGVRNDSTATTFGANNDYTPIAVDAQGAVFTRPSTRRAVSISGQESIAAPLADTWYIRKQWALPSGAFFTPSHAWAAITTALTKTLLVIANNLGNLNVGTNTYTAANSVASPFFYSRLFGCVTTVLSATLDAVTPTYTDELGNSQATAAITFAASTPVGSCQEFPLATSSVVGSALDSGVRAVTTATDSAATTGVITFYGVTALADFAGTAANQTEVIEFPPATSPELEPNEQIIVLMRQVLTTAQLKTFGIAGTIR